MAQDYIINLNYGRNSWPAMNRFWFSITGGLDVGQAMGVMGLTYSILKYNSIILNFETTSGQIVSVPLT